MHTLTTTFWITSTTNFQFHIKQIDVNQKGDWSSPYFHIQAKREGNKKWNWETERERESLEIIRALSFDLSFTLSQIFNILGFQLLFFLLFTISISFYSHIEWDAILFQHIDENLKKKHYFSPFFFVYSMIGCVFTVVVAFTKSYLHDLFRICWVFSLLRIQFICTCLALRLSFMQTSFSEGTGWRIERYRIVNNIKLKFTNDSFRLTSNQTQNRTHNLVRL